MLWWFIGGGKLDTVWQNQMLGIERDKVVLATPGVSEPGQSEGPHDRVGHRSSLPAREDPQAIPSLAALLHRGPPRRTGQ